MSGFKFSPENKYWIKGAEGQRRSAQHRLHAIADEHAEKSPVPIEREFRYSPEKGPTDYERHIKTWDNGDMPLYRTLKSLNRCQ